MSDIGYPDPDRYRPYTPPETPTSRQGRVRHVARIVLLVSAGIGLAYLTVRVFGPPPEWLRWAGLLVGLSGWWWTSRRSRRDGQRTGEHPESRA